MDLRLQIAVEEVDLKLILRLKGRLDVPNVTILEKKIDACLEEGRRILLLDCSELKFLSSAGLRLLLSVSEQLKSKKGALLIFSVDRDGMQVVKVAGFDKILLIFDTEQDALQYDGV